MPEIQFHTYTIWLVQKQYISHHIQYLIISLCQKLNSKRITFGWFRGKIYHIVFYCLIISLCQKFNSKRFPFAWFRSKIYYIIFYCLLISLFQKLNSTRITFGCLRGKTSHHILLPDDIVVPEA